ncbi:hypothetical protein JM79_3234 [Gramella sp. Hel_I_59]|uniref:hypothetical protein n=1 Tax=Gramella sp. Hel_I_59 TaxID=1249978 RepID=UPI001151784B|nr:hypothetical protein [Gramella sp. Hel_I_59]TQI72277.1 hypothetical protein JM79_3234 [Gramella sp. Hel_I_59]
MTSQQNEVVDFIKHDRTLSGARKIYNTLPNRSRSFHHQLNGMTSTPANLERAIYQLCRAAGIDQRKMNALLQSPVVKKEETPERGVVILGAGSSGVVSLAARVMTFSADTAEWPDIQSLAADIAEAKDRKAEGRDKPSLIAFIQEERAQLIAEEAKEVPINVKKSIKLREQFPFIKKKDCPDVLKVLVNDLISAYDAYKEGREKLWASMSEEEEKILAQEIVDNFIENKQAYDELEHFHKNGTLLGEHPIFREAEIKAELEKLDGEELRKRYQALRTNVSRNESKAEKAEDVEKKAEYTEKAADYAWQRDYVSELLKSKK